jgi:hypothetical protein
MFTEYFDLKLLVGTILPAPEKVILDEKTMDEWDKFRKLLRGEESEKEMGQ